MKDFDDDVDVPIADQDAFDKILRQTAKVPHGVVKILLPAIPFVGLQVLLIYLSYGFFVETMHYTTETWFSIFVGSVIVLMFVNYWAYRFYKNYIRRVYEQNIKGYDLWAAIAMDDTATYKGIHAIAVPRKVTTSIREEHVHVMVQLPLTGWFRKGDVGAVYGRLTNGSLIPMRRFKVRLAGYGQSLVSISLRVQVNDWSGGPSIDFVNTLSTALMMLHLLYVNNRADIPIQYILFEYGKLLESHRSLSQKVMQTSQSNHKLEKEVARISQLLFDKQKSLVATDTQLDNAREVVERLERMLKEAREKDEQLVSINTALNMRIDHLVRAIRDAALQLLNTKRYGKSTHSKEARAIRHALTASILDFVPADSELVVRYRREKSEARTAAPPVVPKDHPSPTA